MDDTIDKFNESGFCFGVLAYVSFLFQQILK